MKILNNMLIGGTLLCLPVLGFAASPPLVSFEEGTTNPAMPELNVGDPVEGWGVVHENMNIHSPTIGPAHLGSNRIPATLIESYNPLTFPPLTNVAFSGPNPDVSWTPPSPEHMPNACLEDVNGDRVYWVDSFYNPLNEDPAGKKARGFAVVQPYPAIENPALPTNFVGWEIDVEFDEPIKNFFLTMFDFGDFNPGEAVLFNAEMTAYDAMNNVLASQKLEFQSDGLIISILLQVFGDACSALDYRGLAPLPADLLDFDPLLHVNPGYIAGTLEAMGIKRVEVRGAGHDPKIGFDSIDFGEGCTYTRGYWSNHPWSLPEITLGNYTYPEASSDDIFGKANSKNYGQLCAQLAAATLNCDGYNCAPDGIIQSANELLVEKDVACNAPQDFASKADKTFATDLKTLLDEFNQSYPCDDDEEEM